MKYRPLKNIISNKVIVMAALMLAVVISLSFAKDDHNKVASLPPGKDSIASVKAFMGVYEVLMHPRCMNCHPSGDVPLQGDDSHIHTMLPKRGIDGKGVYAMKCNNCHQPDGIAGIHMPPGNVNWHLPPAKMKMVFQGRTPAQLAKQLLDPKQNGGKNIQQLIKHITSDGLVLGGWNPGKGRTLPPVSHKEFVVLFNKWIATGAYAPTGK